ncbi:hypothetical protein ACH5AJ_36605 [Streptomyces rochei]|uniref:hypothetical protein n=1 Tax=Streptomyces rochei TaxID=1928 RepID=UPI003797712E
MVTPAVCATACCGRPAVAAVTTSTTRISIRTDRLTSPRTATAWADTLRCWHCVSALVDQHLTTPAARPATEETRPR